MVFGFTVRIVMPEWDLKAFWKADIYTNNKLIDIPIGKKFFYFCDCYHNARVIVITMLK